MGMGFERDKDGNVGAAGVHEAKPQSRCMHDTRKRRCSAANTRVLEQGGNYVPDAREWSPICRGHESGSSWVGVAYMHRHV